MSEITLFSWIHLSDIHFGHGSCANQWDQKLVLQQIVSDLEKRDSKKLPHPNAIFITGDVGNTGDGGPAEKRTEYQQATTWLEKLCLTLNLKNTDIYMVPGNHDLQRNSSSNRNIKRLLKELKDDAEPIDNALADHEDRKLLLSLFQNYINFAESYGPTDVKRDETFWHCKINIKGGKSLVIVALNTAFLATGSDDFKRLQLGNEQLKYILEEPNGDIVIVLSHHPFDWLADGGNVSDWITQHGNIHLCGHVHNSDSENLRKGGGSSFINIVSGASHSDDEIVGHGYSLGSIILKNNEFFVRIWPRKWSKSKVFKLDHDNVPEGDSFVDHPLKLKDPSPSKIEVTASHKKISIPIKINRDSDPRSSLSIWVGREPQLQYFKDETIKVFAITGIGGQGKSYLASKFIELLPDLFPDMTIWDWRDCREESDIFQTQVLNIIERITGGEVPAYVFRDEPVATIIDNFFRLIEDYAGVFVFDNIDHYIDVEANKPTYEIDLLVQQALRRSHKSKFVLTCRPEVIYNDPSFFQILLPGMNFEESLQLFEKAGIKISDNSINTSIKRIRELTNGHPMWLNVIAQQVSKNNKKFNTIINELELGTPTDLDVTMMRNIWKELNSNQKNVLRCLAETVRPEPTDNLCDYLSPKIKSKQIFKAVKILKSLNLITVKNSPNSKDTLELHPIVKAYIRKQYCKTEQIFYIDNISSYYDRCIQKYSKALSDCVSFNILMYWSSRAELAINADKLKDSLQILNDVSDALLSAGYAEEFIRISSKILNYIDFGEAISQNYKHFDSVLDDYVQISTHLGRYDIAEVTLQKYELLVGKTARFIHLCNMRCYYYWYRNKYTEAKQWGKAGVDLKSFSNMDTHLSCSGHYALAQRDSNEIDEALDYFLEGHSLEEVLNKSNINRDKDGEFYGNIGRCMFLKGDIEGACICYRKSLTLLEGTKSKLNVINKGWGYFWVGEALEKLGKVNDAYAFYNEALKLWSVAAPPKAEKAVAAIGRLKNEESANFGIINHNQDLPAALHKKYLYWGNPY